MSDDNTNHNNNSHNSNNNDNNNNYNNNVDDLDEQVRKLYQGLALAPMVRASTTPLRTLALQYGANFVYTEELVDRSITSTTRVSNTTLNTIDYVKDTSTLSVKVQKRLAKDSRPALLLRIDPQVEQHKLICQLGTGEPELALAAAKHVYQDVTAIDINMGCPKKFSVSGGMGSALLSDPDRACRIIKTIRSELTTKPLSIKIRLLQDVPSTIDFIEAMINAGAQAIAIHARRVGDDSTQPADWDTLRTVMGLLRPKYPTFPFLLNGDFYTQEEINQLLLETQAQGILLARPALYNTSMFRSSSTLASVKREEGGDCSSSSSSTTNWLDKTTVVQEYLQHAVRYDAHYKNVKYVICEMMNNRRTPTPRVPYLPHIFPGGQTIAKTCNCHSMEELCSVWDVNFAQYLYSNKNNGLLSTNNNNNNNNNKSVDHSSSQDLSPGEHKYEDSYFLKDVKSTTSVISSTPTPIPNSTMNGSSAKADDNDNNNDCKPEPQAKRICLNGNSSHGINEEK